MGHVIAGRYELHDMVARGGMGSVWVARDLRDGQTVAVKLLHQVEASDLLRFVREAGVRLDHPHIAAPLGWVAEDDQVAFAMPLVRGGSAADLVRGRGPLPAPFVAELLRQLLAALGHVHAQGWVHRDVKPGNLLLDPCPATGRPRVRLTDFGIAVPVDEPRLTHTVDSGGIGTPGYMPPEGTADADPRADLYAAGVTGQVLLTGSRPRDLGAATEVEEGPLWQVLRRLTDPDVTRRPDSAQAALADLEVPELAWPTGGAGVVVPDVVAALGPVVDGPGEASAEPAPRRRRGWLVAATALALVVGVGGAVALATVGDDDPSGKGTASRSTPASSETTRVLTKDWVAARVATGEECAADLAGRFAVTQTGGVAECTSDGGTRQWQSTTGARVSPRAVRTAPPAEPTWSSRAQVGGEPCDEVGEYAIAQSQGWLVRCNGTVWIPESVYPAGDGSGRSEPDLYLPAWVDTRVPFGEACRTQGELMITRGGYPARCFERKEGGHAWVHAPEEMPVHWDATRSDPPAGDEAPRWDDTRPERESRCATAGEYGIEGGGWLVRCKDGVWALESQYPLPPGAREGSDG
ncbi:protein kinase domain-containing protein [Janibacter sp. G368]|uniref:serine/threonine-protein kinase n=1 Tax=Janibacter sp. G368 TaxID=3420441 RepID=UPI003D03DFF8